jgi:hypothetical protein
MHVRRAGHVVARPLNWGVVRPIETTAVIKHLKYMHGAGYTTGAKYPDSPDVGLSLGASQITWAIQRSYEVENITALSGCYGDADSGDPVEVDILTVEDDQRTVSVTIFNRGIALLTSADGEMSRLHRFISVVERELSK